ncbi:hypothetical protein GQ54DRAFT_298499 [Martensiomyces pterosporus]|nr:hypothetical protein GQ54DRAFT_298499 [Martensiomyces pterosporus]
MSAMPWPLFLLFAFGRQHASIAHTWMHRNMSITACLSASRPAKPHVEKPVPLFCSWLKEKHTLFYLYLLSDDRRGEEGKKRRLLISTSHEGWRWQKGSLFLCRSCVERNQAVDKSVMSEAVRSWLFLAWLLFMKKKRKQTSICTSSVTSFEQASTRQTLLKPPDADRAWHN